MLFTLEALDANEGDCLLLLYGSAARPRVIVIDGGPRATCADALLPRLLELREALGHGHDALPIELVVVSHVDSDHIGGVVAWTAELRAMQGAEQLPFQIKELWHNSFDDVIGASEVEGAVDFIDGLPTSERAGLVASIGEGRTLREDAEVLGIAVNAEFTGLVVRGDTGGAEVQCGDGLRLTVLGPARQQLLDFQREWDAARRAAKPAAGRVTAAQLDTSRPNLASITLLAESGGRTILLAGDARGDHLLEGLEVAGVLPPGGTMRVDVLKLPHHGSCRNVTTALLQRVLADTYVISADGKHGNPDLETLERLTAAREGAAYTVVCTFSERAHLEVEGAQGDAAERRAALQAFHDWARRQPAQVKIVHRPAEAYGVAIALGDESLA